MSEEIKEIFRKAFERSLTPRKPEEVSLILERVDEILDKLKRGVIKPGDAYLMLIGLAYEHIVPITPKEEVRLKELCKKVLVTAR